MKAHANFCENHPASLFAVHDAYTILDQSSVVSHAFDCCTQSATRRNDVFDEEHTVVGTQLSFEVSGETVFLPLFSDQKNWFSGLETDSGRDWYRSEFYTGDSIHFRGVTSHGFGNRVEHSRLGHGSFDVDIIGGSLAAGQREFAELQSFDRKQVG